MKQRKYETSTCRRGKRNECLNDSFATRITEIILKFCILKSKNRFTFRFCKKTSAIKCVFSLISSVGIFR